MSSGLAGRTIREFVGRMRACAWRRCQTDRRRARRDKAAAARRPRAINETKATDTMPTAPTPGAAADLIGQFLRSLEVRGMSPATRRSYASDLSQFDEWSQECGQALAGLDRSAVRAFAAALGRRGYAPATLARKLSTMRSFCRFLTERGVLAADPAQYLPGPRRRRRLPHALRPSEVDAVCDAVRGSDALALRDRLAFELLYGCGLRSQELVDLGCDDVHAQRGELLVRGKGGKMRMVPLGDEAGAALERYLASGRASAQPQRTATAHLRRAAHRRQVRPPCRSHGLAAHVPARLCHAHARARRRPAGHPGAPRPQLGIDHADLHARQRRSPQSRPSAAPSASVTGVASDAAISAVRHDAVACGQTKSGGSIGQSSPWAALRVLATW